MSHHHHSKVLVYLLELKDKTEKESERKLLQSAIDSVELNIDNNLHTKRHSIYTNMGTDGNCCNSCRCFQPITTYKKGFGLCNARCGCDVHFSDICGSFKPIKQKTDNETVN